MKEKAVGYFHEKEHYNCAQAIIKTFCPDYSEEEIAKYNKMGGGKAEGGLCGAVYAANKLLSNTGKSSELESKLVELAGSTKCREILKLKKLSCKDCLRLVAGFLETEYKTK